MQSITDGMLHHHKHCDDEFAAAEEAAHQADWTHCQAAFGRFRKSMEGHFQTEETILFPAFEQRSGMVGGPTEVMRTEHAQMRGLLAQMETALKARDKKGFGGAAETLLVLMQQHNMKEENILYPMCDQALGGETQLLQKIAEALEANA